MTDPTRGSRPDPTVPSEGYLYRTVEAMEAGPEHVRAAAVLFRKCGSWGDAESLARLMTNRIEVVGDPVLEPFWDEVLWFLVAFRGELPTVDVVRLNPRGPSSRGGGRRRGRRRGRGRRRRDARGSRGQ